MLWIPIQDSSSQNESPSENQKDKYNQTCFLIPFNLHQVERKNAKWDLMEYLKKTENLMGLKNHEAIENKLQICILYKEKILYSFKLIIWINPC